MNPLNQPRGPSGKEMTNAFTLLELLVVISVITLLAAMLMPSLAKAKFSSLVSACASNYKQWGYACNVYAAGNQQGCYPSFALGSQPGENVADLASSFITNMNPYGMTVPMYFCPARLAATNVFGADDAWFYNNLPGHRHIQNTGQLSQFYLKRNPYGNYIMLDCLVFWVPRTTSGGAGGGRWWPYTADYPTNNGGYNEQYNPIDISNGGWPLKTSDLAAPKQPVVSDLCVAYGNYQTNAPNARLDPTTGHPFNGKVASVNIGFADGHAETRPLTVMDWHMVGNNYAETWYY
jgi:prepilin-type N-terminal cleavage/methylation domain-containing protein/prepilin-type processing-associated H-X9-DG protein